MVATSVTFSPKVAADWDPQKPLTTTKLNQLYDNTTNLHERLGGSYSSNTKDHSHDGVDSFKIQVGSNMVRNGDFENGLAGWTATNYTLGTVAASTQDADGTSAVQITSTVLANGGGDILSNEFMVVIGGAQYQWSVNEWASAANVSSQLEAVFYDSTQSLISSSTLLSSANTATTNTRYTGAVTVPATARYMKIRATGGVPATGSATGTVYFDGVQISFRPLGVVAGGNYSYLIGGSNSITGAWTSSPSEAGNMRINASGVYRVSFAIAAGSSSQTVNARIYKNGIAYGTQRTNSTTTPVVYTEDLQFNSGDTMQFYTWGTAGNTIVSSVKFGILSNTMEGYCAPVAAAIGDR